MTPVTGDLLSRLERIGGSAGASVRQGERWTVLVDDIPTGPEVFAHSVARGLSDHPRWLHCRYLYDAEGSRIFQRIMEQPEYYPTRAEASILRERADEIREAVGDATIVELGAGSGEKTRWLLEAWAERSDTVAYVPIDIDPTVLVEAAGRLVEHLPTLEVRALATSYERGLDAVAHLSPMCLVFLGSTIGNLNPDEMDVFLARLERSLSPEDSLLLGVDLVKSPKVLEAAYDDAAGWSAAFTRNLFARMNRELGTDIDPESVDHVAYWNDRLERIEIHARFRRAAMVELAPSGRRFRLAAGEMVLTEISRKFRIESIESDLARFGFRLERHFTDSDERFAILLFRRIARRTGPPEWMCLAALLQVARRRTLDLIDALGDDDLRRQALPHLSPIAWDLGHMAEFEALWLVRAVDALQDPGADAGALEEIYDATRVPREERGRLELPDRESLLSRLRQVRRDALDRLRTVELEGHPLLEEGFVYRMLAQHEAQHQETILQAVARMEDVAYEPAHRVDPPRGELPPDVEMVRIPAGPFPAGAGDDPAAYDNERPRHWVDLPAYWIDTAPITNGDLLAFMEHGGYERSEWWSEEGWAWLAKERPEPHPLGWRAAEGGWVEERFGRVEPLVPSRPVLHVSAHEADAYARSVGKRLPTEFEWEKAAAWDPEVRLARRWPWGDEAPGPRRANLDAVTFTTAPVGAYPAGRSFYGCHQMIGDAWEWTASEFLPYPGFRPFPYPEYSEIHFGKGYRVLRGGSWATSSTVARTTFRNWDWPHRRQIFAGFRCARDA